MSLPRVIPTATLVFGTTTYQVKSISVGLPKTAEAIDVTVCSDTKKRFVTPALARFEDITVTIAADTPPTVNTIEQHFEIQISSTQSIVISDCDIIVKSVTPLTIEAGGERELVWEVVFTSTGLEHH